MSDQLAERARQAAQLRREEKERAELAEQVRKQRRRVDVVEHTVRLIMATLETPVDDITIVKIEDDSLGRIGRIFVKIDGLTFSGRTWPPDPSRPGSEWRLQRPLQLHRICSTIDCDAIATRNIYTLADVGDTVDLRCAECKP
jgi:hypothetical protein